jgi:hypothetical protein
MGKVKVPFVVPDDSYFGLVCKTTSPMKAIYFGLGNNKSLTFALHNLLNGLDKKKFSSFIFDHTVTAANTNLQQFYRKFCWTEMV